MKFLVFSDSHGSMRTMLRAVDLHKNTIDGVLFLGDGLYDLISLRTARPDLAVRGVRGNCDAPTFSQAGYETLDCFTIDQIKIMMCHGHLYSVKYGTQRLLHAARAHGADIALFGHTHHALNQYMPPKDDSMTKGIYLCNPGAAKDGCYGILECGPFGISFQTADIYPTISSI